MAKHEVICLYCGEKFDAKKEEEGIVWTKPNSRRYAHINCPAAPKEQMNKTKIEHNEFDELYQYVKDVQKNNFNFVKFKKIVEKYKKDYNYSYSGMLKSLQWFYDVKRNPKDKFIEGSLGIIPFVYQDAYNYYYKIFIASQNSNTEYEKKEKVIKIKAPEQKREKPKLFFD